MDFSLLSQVIQELDANLRGGRIDRVSRNIQGDILLTVIKDRKSFTWCFWTTVAPSGPGGLFARCSTVSTAAPVSTTVRFTAL
jgi:hypothetical protein